RGAFVDGLLDTIPVLPFGLPEARRHADVWAELAKRGTMIGPHDLLVGATALAHGHALVTLNRREFRRVPGLVVREWKSGCASAGQQRGIRGRRPASHHEDPPADPRSSAAAAG